MGPQSFQKFTHLDYCRNLMTNLIVGVALVLMSFTVFVAVR